MSDDQAKIQQELSEIQNELNTTGMSRRKFLDRLKGAGLGFGALAVAGTSAQAHTGQGAVTLNSTNEALGKIVEDAQASQAVEAGDEAPGQLAQYYYYRRYRRYGRTYYRRYVRYYRRYARYYYRRYYW